MTTTPRGEDEDLVQRFLAGEAPAFDRLVERHAAGVVRALEALVGDHHSALDLAQETFLRLYGFLPRYRSEGRFRALLYGMAFNLARDVLRARKRERLVAWDDEVLSQSRSGGDVELEQRQAIEAALAHVRSPFREALALRELSGLGYAEIAALLGCAEGAAKSRVARGRIEFRRAFEEQRKHARR